MLPLVMTTSPFVSPDAEYEIRRRFLCCLHQRSDANNDIDRDGMAPGDIYNRIGPPPEKEELVNRKVQWLVDHCREKGYSEPGNNDGIRMTDLGHKHCNSQDKYGRSYCYGLPSYNNQP
jgi:hypothetical protein